MKKDFLSLLNCAAKIVKSNNTKNYGTVIKLEYEPSRQRLSVVFTTGFVLNKLTMELPQEAWAGDNTAVISIGDVKTIAAYLKACDFYTPLKFAVETEMASVTISGLPVKLSSVKYPDYQNILTDKGEGAQKNISLNRETLLSLLQSIPNQIVNFKVFDDRINIEASSPTVSSVSTICSAKV